jgi:hypothetical protein
MRCYTSVPSANARASYHALEAELAGVFQDKLAVTSFMAIELKARLVLDQRLEKRFALDELKVRDIPTAKMQEIESVIDELHASFAIGRRLRLGKLGKPASSTPQSSPSI